MTEAQALKFVEAKTKGLNNSQAALVAKPNLKPSSAGIAGHRMIKSANVQAILNKKLKKHHITIDRVLKPIDDALDANKTVIIGKGDDAFADEVVDHPTRLKASAMGQKLLGLDQPAGPAEASNQNMAPELAAALKRGDISELQRIIFKEPQIEPEEDIKKPVLIEAKQGTKHHVKVKKA